ncbi:MAG: hypothetical protein HY286_01445 [Planctomycetes bacterium]|nr:hypothetical protein [Planctomycetota bacterium]
MLWPSHAIFAGPFAIHPEITNKATPDNFKKFKPSVGPTVPVFTIFSKKHAEPGLVTADHGFEDAPDAERILGGINMKGPDYAAIARHGSFVMWGFHGLPEDFTDNGRRLFLNAIAYAHAHKGQVVETLRSVSSRAALAEFFTIWMPFYEKTQQKNTFQRYWTGEDPPDSIFENTQEALKWVAARAPYFHAPSTGDWGDQFKVCVDAQCKEFGVGNGDPEFPKTIAARLAKDPKDELAKFLCERYFPDVSAAEFPAWFDKNGAKLIFTETGGYVWRVRGERAHSGQMRVKGADPAADLVSVKGEASDNSLQIEVRIKDGWHLTAPVAKEGQPISLNILPDSSFAEAGPIKCESDQNGQLTRFALLTLPLKHKSSGRKLRVEFTYTACDAMSCQPPKSLVLEWN